MSNLGAFQEITTAAKAAGGVDLLIKAIEKGAVQKAAPSLGIARIGHESRAAGGSCIPSVDGPCSTDQTADDDDRAG